MKRRIDIIKDNKIYIDNIKVTSDVNLIDIFQALNATLYLDKMSPLERECNALIKKELNERGYAIVPGTCVPQIKKRDELTEWELNNEW